MRRRGWAARRWLAVVIVALVALVALALAGCGGGGEQRTAPVQEDGLVIGPGVQLPLVIDGDRLGVSSLDGNPPAEIAGPGDYRGVQYDAQGRLLYVQQAGRDPGFYRVENGLPHKVCTRWVCAANLNPRIRDRSCGLDKSLRRAEDQCAM